ncbi:AsmA family protein [Futiania mangrovi]|uniref:AsmA family protein n=1 Tax=Futiania mangrovi TaxID=2959716 RepID=A0A9J6PE26_9PROT|nr:AsmA family protein [Futiania mangrovii]MCP1337661.1 AsmA family protein [Futiania mangrovii]
MLKRILIGLGILVVVLIAGVVALPFLIPAETIKTQVASAVERATGRTLTISGDVAPSVFPSLGVEAGGITLSNAEGASDPDMIAAEQITAKLALMPLLTGEVKVEGFRLVKPVIHLEVAEDGTPNWMFGKPGGEGGTAGRQAPAGEGRGDASEGAGQLPRNISLENVEIVDGLVTFTDRRTGERREASEINLAVSLPAIDQPLTAKGGLRLDGEQADIDVTLDTLASAQAGERTRIEARLASQLATIAFAGTVQPGGPLPAVDGTFELKVPSTDALAEWTGQSLPDDAAPLESIDVTGRLRADADGVDTEVKGAAGWNGRQMTVDVTARGEGDPRSGAPVALDAKVTSDLLSASYAGTVAMTDALPLLDGTYSLGVPAPADLGTWLGQPVSPTLAALSGISFQGRVKRTDAALEATSEGALTWRGEPFAITLTANAAGDPMAGVPIAIDAAVASPKVTTTFKGTGTAGNAPAVKGRLTVDSPSVRDLLAWLEIPVETPQGTLGALALQTGVDATPARVALEALTLNLDEASVTGDIRAAGLNGRPDVKGTLALANLNVDAFAGAAGGGDAPAQAKPAEDGWSDAPIDLSALSLADADLKLTAANVRAGGLKLDKAASRLLLKDGTLRLDLSDLGLYGGTGGGRITLAAGGAAPQLASALKLAGVQLGPLLKDAADFTRLEGTGNVEMDVTTAGGSVKQMVSALGGKGAIDVRDGAIVGINLAAMVRNAANAFLDSSARETQKTDFAALTATYTIAKGIVTNNDLALVGPLLRVTGAGTVDLPARTVDYRIEPKAVASLQGQGGQGDLKGIVVPVVVSGPWSNLSYRPDLTGAITGALRDPQALQQGLEGLKGGGTDAIRSLLGGGGTSEGGTTEGTKSPLGGVLDKVLGGSQTQQAPAQESPSGTTTTQEEPAPSSSPPSPKDLLRGLLNR